MNKYQDFQNRREISKSFANLPTIRSGGLSINIKKQFTFEDFSPITKRGTPINFSEITPTMKNSPTKLSKISELSVKHNNLAGSFFQIQEHEESKSLQFPEISLRPMPSEKDFSRLIESFNSITSPKNLYKPLYLKEQESVEICVNTNEVKYCKIAVKGKRTPLTIKIYRAFGRVITYVSSTVCEPGANNCDKQYSCDYFEVREQNEKFKYDSVYLSVKGLEESEIRIHASFGKKCVSLQQLKSIKHELSLKVKDSENSILFRNESLKVAAVPQTTRNKDFVSENKCVDIRNSSTKAGDLAARGETWKNKREMVLKRKKTYLDEKKQKAVQLLNRQKIKKEKENILREEIQAKNKKILLEKNWIGIIFFSNTLGKIADLIRSEKQKKLTKVNKMQKIRKIQSFLRSRTKDLSSEDLSLFRARNLLLLFHSNLKVPLVHTEIMRNLKKTISEAAHSHILFHKFALFIEKVIYIQRAFRKYGKVRYRRIVEIIKLWDLACQNMLFSKGSNKKHRKKESINLIAIPKNVRDALIREHYQGCLLKFRGRIRKHAEKVDLLAPSKLFKTAINYMCDFTPEVFHYLPSAKELEKLIEKAKSSYRNNKY